MDSGIRNLRERGEGASETSHWMDSGIRNLRERGEEASETSHWMDSGIRNLREREEGKRQRPATGWTPASETCGRGRGEASDTSHWMDSGIRNLRERERRGIRNQPLDGLRHQKPAGEGEERHQKPATGWTPASETCGRGRGEASETSHWMDSGIRNLRERERRGIRNQPLDGLRHQKTAGEGEGRRQKPATGWTPASETCGRERGEASETSHWMDSGIRNLRERERRGIRNQPLDGLRHQKPAGEGGGEASETSHWMDSGIRNLWERERGGVRNQPLDGLRHQKPAGEREERRQRPATGWTPASETCGRGRGEASETSHWMDSGIRNLRERGGGEASIS